MLPGIERTRRDVTMRRRRDADDVQPILSAMQVNSDHESITR